MPILWLQIPLVLLWTSSLFVKDGCFFTFAYFDNIFIYIITVDHILNLLQLRLLSNFDYYCCLFFDFHHGDKLIFQRGYQWSLFDLDFHWKMFFDLIKIDFGSTNNYAFVCSLLYNDFSFSFTYNSYFVCSLTWDNVGWFLTCISIVRHLLTQITFVGCSLIYTTNGCLYLIDPNVADCYSKYPTIINCLLVYVTGGCSLPWANVSNFLI